MELTSSNFASAVGFYAHAKDAVNASIRDINQAEFFWPFNHTVQTDTLTADQSRNPFPSDAKVIDFGSFRIKENSSFGNDTVFLKEITYEEYLKYHVGNEYATAGSVSATPSNIVHAPSLEYIVVPPPDEAYDIVYEYYATPTDLSAATDVPTIPERFRHNIIDGAMYYAYLFRSNAQQAAIMKQKFDEGIKDMRSQLVNSNYVHVTSSMVPRNTGGGSYYNRANFISGY